MRTRVQSITISETPVGWLNQHTGRLHPTAAQAIRSVRRSDKQVANEYGMTVTVISWRPTTRVGRLVARAIAG